MDFDFDLQRFLTEMEGRLTVKIEGIDRRVVGVVTVVNEHETRIVVIENTRRAMKWLMGVAIVGLIGFLGNWLAHAVINVN